MAAAVSDKSDRIKHLVADSAAFLKRVPLDTIAENVYTISEVVSEIKDAATRQSLAVLPYEIQFRQPSTEALKAVTEFSKLTGDFKVLSAVDLRVMALTYQLEKEFCGVEHLKTKPTQQVQYSQGVVGNNLPGFYVEKNAKDPSSTQDETEIPSTEPANNDCEDPVGDDSDKTLEDEIDEISGLPGCSISEKCTTDTPMQASESQSLSQVQEYPKEDNDIVEDDTQREEDDLMDANNPVEDTGDDEGFVEEDEDGWITPENILRIRTELNAGRPEAEAAVVEVGCLTTDFAMQNVLIQMGLHVVSVDGLLIREAKSYVHKCYACFRVSHEMKQFCPWCGNKTMTRVSMTVDEHGVIRYNVPTRKRPFNIRGKKFPLPMPQGGRFAENPVLVEDQPRGQRRLPPKRDKVDVLNPDYVARASPFTANDVNSRAVQHGFHVTGNYWNKRNPNEVKKSGGRRKKK